MIDESRTCCNVFLSACPLRSFVIFIRYFPCFLFPFFPSRVGVYVKRQCTARYGTSRSRTSAYLFSLLPLLPRCIKANLRNERKNGLPRRETSVRAYCVEVIQKIHGSFLKTEDLSVFVDATVAGRSETTRAHSDAAKLNRKLTSEIDERHCAGKRIPLVPSLRDSAVLERFFFKFLMLVQGCLFLRQS